MCPVRRIALCATTDSRLPKSSARSTHLQSRRPWGRRRRAGIAAAARLGCGRVTPGTCALLRRTGSAARFVNRPTCSRSRGFHATECGGTHWLLRIEALSTSRPGHRRWRSLSPSRRVKQPSPAAYRTAIDASGPVAPADGRRWRSPLRACHRPSRRIEARWSQAQHAAPPRCRREYRQS